MNLSPGTKLGGYEIVDTIGVGGMGEVYRARDWKLQRDVAIKVLPTDFARDPDRVARFQREAQLLAALNHANIGVIHDFQMDRQTHFLVMEFIEGDNLVHRLQRGRIPLDEALEICKQVADGLEAAHEKGILHRDLKPANIQITPNGGVKVLDFGLAKLAETETTEVTASDSPTLATHTGKGVILGTAAYMSPEQARARHLDKRTDIWAFGCVLYETLTCHAAFEGESVTDILASIVKSEPDWTRLPPETPMSIRLLLRQCLQKPLRHRLHDIADARLAIETAIAEPEQRGTTHDTAETPEKWFRYAAVLAVLVLAFAAGWLVRRPPEAPRAITRLQMGVEPAEQLGVSELASVRPSRTSIAISPDGKLVVFAGTRNNVTQLFSRTLDQSEANPIPGTEGAVHPVFSPDGRWIAFWADNKIKKIPSDGGPVVPICEVTPGTRGLGSLNWTNAGAIFFVDFRGLWKLNPESGKPDRIPNSDSSVALVHPHPLPDGKTLLVTVYDLRTQSPSVGLLSLETGQRRPLIEKAMDARYLKTGHLLYMQSGTLMAVPFDAAQLQLAGTSVPMIAGVMHAVNSTHDLNETGDGQYAVSESGTLLYVAGGMHPNLEFSMNWVDRQGMSTRLKNSVPATYFSTRLSPDGSKIAVTLGNPGTAVDAWLYDVDGRPLTPLTTNSSGWYPIWSPEGRRIVYSSSKPPNGLFLINPNTPGEPERLLTTGDDFMVASSWTAAGDLLAVLQSTVDENRILVVPVNGDRTPRVFLKTPYNIGFPEFSPDGRWIAYVSNETGTNEVWVRPYPGPGEKIPISNEGGTIPVWTPDGRELLYVQRRHNDFGGLSKVFAVPVQTLTASGRANPRLLFEAKPNEYDSPEPIRGLDLTRDGRRLLLTRYEQSKDEPPSNPGRFELD